MLDVLLNRSSHIVKNILKGINIEVTLCRHEANKTDDVWKPLKNHAASLKGVDNDLLESLCIEL